MGWILDFLLQRYQRVKVNSVLSSVLTSSTTLYTPMTALATMKIDTLLLSSWMTQQKSIDFRHLPPAPQCSVIKGQDCFRFEVQFEHFLCVQERTSTTLCTQETCQVPGGHL